MTGGRGSERTERVFHVVVLSNFARAYDKYLRAYRKSLIPESRHPGVVHVLAEHELVIGAAKTERLRSRLGIEGDALLALAADLDPACLAANTTTGLGRIWPFPDLPLAAMHAIDPDGRLGAPWSVESAMSRSLALHAGSFVPYERLAPRSISFLPVARGCQARCPFCFSEASVSRERRSSSLSDDEARRWLALAAARGAERAVITGGGEPMLAPRDRVMQLVRAARSALGKVVLITNGVALARANDAASEISDLEYAGLSVLAVSRHHPDEATNAASMGLSTETPRLLAAARTVRSRGSALRLRLICVLQRGLVDSVDAIDDYVRWAASEGVDEVCFKELYVSTSTESVYHSHEANLWSEAHQTPLADVVTFARARGLREEGRLPWGAPVFSGSISGRAVRVAAYTEPSLFWERHHGMARSWNIMADGRCLASLEDRESEIVLGDAA